ncbi:MAG: reverse transcriptase family protein, partial [Desulfobacteraceae bacterium]|nr:reverse transcriptase family protein [Desulfobacteraceae bacterium]
FKKAKLSKLSSDWDNFASTRKYYYNEIVKAKDNYTENTYEYLSTHTVRSKSWWSLLKEVHSNAEIDESVPPLEHNGQIITSDFEKADIFNKHFLKASQLDDSNSHLPQYQRIADPDRNFDNIDITVSDVWDQVKCLDSSKSYGPDGISPIFIKEGSNKLIWALQKLFQLSISKAMVPDSFKKANVVPIHKKQHKTLVENYRPISLLSILSKIFEKIVFKYLFNYFKDNFILSLFQSGFQPGISTVTQLLEVYHHFCKAVDDNKEIRVVFLDISKAFDRVWHKGLLFKLKQCGIGGKMFEWFVDYLENRFQRVVINGQASSWLPISAGVPQGSVLGPLLFLVYINDIVHVVRHR